MHEPDNQELAGKVDRFRRDLNAVSDLAHETHDEQTIMWKRLTDLEAQIADLKSTLVTIGTAGGDTMEAHGTVVNPIEIVLTDTLHLGDTVTSTSSGGTALPKP